MNTSPPKIIVFGADGQIGWELIRCLQPLGKIIPANRRTLDITDFDSVKKFIRMVKPQIIINAAAYIDVENVNEHIDTATKVNAHFPGLIASESELCGALLVHYSTDSVFDGKSRVPYFENDKTGPLNFYAATKLAGETEIQNTKAKSIIFRIGWVYSLRRKNFLLAIQNKAESKSKLRVVCDQWGSPSWARSIADLTSQVVYKQLLIKNTLDKSASHRLYHMASQDYTNWYDFAVMILNNETTAELEPIKTSEYLSKVVRPNWTVLNSDKLWNDFNLYLPGWREQLNLSLNRIAPN